MNYAVVVAAIGRDIKDGKFMLNPHLIPYLERSGLYEPKENPDEGTV